MDVLALMFEIVPRLADAYRLKTIFLLSCVPAHLPQAEDG